ncbi:MAG: single-stranded-DNA-specific exonuclease RecJ [Henriciella sp.]|nr:single-stranded-DNA-specific exonuclease RecJ [Henriciella sp.]
MVENAMNEQSPFVAQSHGGRFWTVNAPDDASVRALTPRLGGDDLLARLLAPRGIEPDQVETFLNPTLRALFPDPASFQDMMKAAELVLDAIIDGRNVTVFADYDVDGGTSSAILTRYFRAWGRELGLYVPGRLTEGYGPSPEAFRHLKETGADLVITVDCGAAATAALAEAEAIGLPVIVIDHHLMGKTPPACAALVNPNRADDTSGQGHLAAAGVVYVFAAALNKLARERDVAPPRGLPDILNWLDLCALGTLCDMSPLRGANRAFVKQGLKILERGQNPGLRALADIAGIGKIESVYHATFVLGPRLNAGGRVGDPWLAAKLLATEDRSEAIALAERLHAHNDERKSVESAILEQATTEAQKQIEANPDAGILIAAGEGWHPGVIGIVAGRLKDRFHLPAIVIGWGQGLGPVAKGSARSVRGVNIGDAISAAAKAGIILSGGGHAMAGGLSLEPEQLEGLQSWMQEHMAEFKEERAAAKELAIDALLAPSQVSTETYDLIQTIGPFGQGAPEPVFAIKDVEITHTRPIGENHLKLTVEDAGARIEALVWRCVGTPLGDALLQRGRVHLAGRLKDNVWNGRRTAQFEVIDAAAAT